MRNRFNDKEIEFLQKAHVSDINDSIEISEKLGDHMSMNGLDINYNPTDEGRMCLEILNSLDDLFS